MPRETKKLWEITSIISGSNKPIPKDHENVEGGYKYITRKHYSSTPEFDETLPIRTFGLSYVIRNQVLDVGDILFASKGANFIAGIITKDMLPAIASADFFVIRLKKFAEDFIKPEYLLWFLQNEIIMNYAEGQAHHHPGGKSMHIKKSVLTEMEIPIISFEEQDKILHIQTLQKKIASLQNQLNEEMNKATFQVLYGEDNQILEVISVSSENKKAEISQQIGKLQRKIFTIQQELNSSNSEIKLPKEVVKNLKEISTIS